MAIMSRILTQSLISRAPFLHPTPALTTHHRHRSTKSHQAQLIEVDLAESAVGMKNLEDLIHGMIVRRAAPDWLPFIPGSSYWVPPPRSGSGSVRKMQSSDAMIDLIRKFSDLGARIDGENPASLSDEERRSCSSQRGWPCSSFYMDHSNSPRHAKPVVDSELNIKDGDDGISNRASNSEDEEG